MMFLLSQILVLLIDISQLIYIFNSHNAIVWNNALYLHVLIVWNVKSVSLLTFILISFIVTRKKLMGSAVSLKYHIYMYQH